MSSIMASAAMERTAEGSAEQCEMELKWLTLALRGARAAATSAKEQRLLAWQAMEVSRAGMLRAGRPDKPPASDAMDDFEVVMANLRERVGCEAPLEVSRAKAVLRAKGPRGAQAASWLSSLSRLRSGKAHDKKHLLLSEFATLFEQQPEYAESTTASEDCSE